MDRTNDPGSAGQLMDVDHDHAWSKMGLGDPADHLLVGQYSCDLCGAGWSL